jgi:peroxin-7
MAGHTNEILSVDWNKYQRYMMVTGSIDCTAHIWDIRAPGSPLSTITGHEMGIRRVKWSPHHGSILATSGYDMAVRLWSVAEDGTWKSLDVLQHHTEFVFGLDFNLHHAGLMATGGWDERIHVFTPQCLK